SRVHSIHPTTQILRDPNSAVHTRSKVNKSSGAHAFVDAMQEELLQFKTQNVWILVDLPFGKKVVGIKWVYRNKKDERGLIVRTKASIFLAFASYMGFIVYQMDVKSAFLYEKIDEEVYVSQPLGLVDPKFLKKVYMVVKALYCLHQAPRAWYATLSTFLVKSRYRRGIIDNTLFIKKDKKDIMLVTPKNSHLHVLKKIFRYLKGQPKLGLWYPRESAFDLEAYSDSDYDGVNLDKKSSTRGDFNKLSNLVDEGADYAVNEERLTDKINVLNAETKGVSAASETLNAATLAVSTARSRMKRMSKRKKTDVDLEEEEQLRAFLKIIPNEEGQVNYAVLNKSKELASPTQIALDNDFLNPLMANSLPKTIW
nr:hypothetical protein [Tanacetum cinerariifolium]